MRATHMYEQRQDRANKKCAEMYYHTIVKFQSDYHKLFPIGSCTKLFPIGSCTGIITTKDCQQKFKVSNEVTQ